MIASNFSSVPKGEIPPSLPLQILLYFNNWYTLGWFATNVVLFIWKQNQFFYETSSFRWEVSIIFFVFMTDLIRLELGSRGNKTSECIVLIWSCCLAVPTIVGLCFFLRLQSYVLRLDVILNTVALIFVTFEVILQLWNISQFYFRRYYGSYYGS